MMELDSILGYLKVVFLLLWFCQIWVRVNGRYLMQKKQKVFF